MSTSSPNEKERSLAILFGASEFVRYPDWSRTSFKHSVCAVEEYLLDPAGLDVKREDILNLFDSASEPSQQLAQIEAFLSKRNADDDSDAPVNLIIYYVGHGCFSGDKHHCFALRGTRPFPLGGSALRGGDLAEVIRQCAAHLRRFLFIDCCFAAALFSEFQASSPGSVFETQIDEELPGSGTALLCASSKDLPALAPQAWKYTMFGGALIEALRQGDRRMASRMSLRDIETLCRSIIRRNSPDNYTRPELHVPRADEGDIANLNIFPNPAWAAQQAVEKRRKHQAKAEAQARELQAEQERRAEIERMAAQLIAERERVAVEQRLAAEKRQAKRQRLKDEKAAKRAETEAREFERLQAETEAQKKAERDRLERANAEAKLLAERDRKEAEANWVFESERLRIEAEARKKRESERRTREEAEARKKARAEAEQAELLRWENEKRTRAEWDRLRAEAEETRKRAETEAKDRENATAAKQRASQASLTLTSWLCVAISPVAGFGLAALHGVINAYLKTPVLNWLTSAFAWIVLASVMLKLGLDKLENSRHGVVFGFFSAACFGLGYWGCLALVSGVEPSFWWLGLALMTLIGSGMKS